LGDPNAAAAALKMFQALTDDMRSTLAEFKYTRMGALSEALVEAPAAPTSDIARTTAPALGQARELFGGTGRLPSRICLPILIRLP